VAGGGVYSSGEPLNVFFNPNLTSTDVVTIATLPKVPPKPLNKEYEDKRGVGREDNGEGEEEGSEKRPNRNEKCGKSY
jgi:hypothetical protein